MGLVTAQLRFVRNPDCSAFQGTAQERLHRAAEIMDQRRGRMTVEQYRGQHHAQDASVPRRNPPQQRRRQQQQDKGERQEQARQQHRRMMEARRHEDAREWARRENKLIRAAEGQAQLARDRRNIAEREARLRQHVIETGWRGDYGKGSKHTRPLTNRPPG